ncbi:MAG: hypothetical protein CME61_04135 [Halobacteriovoraceae bacterium]|nr:hypothetical protein [Halobacteriovoraceae bacterium]
MLSETSEIINITLFCGGRGSANLVKEFVRRSNVKLNLILNGYDNGLSTGVIRILVDGILGPSDFRKNLSHLLEIHSPNQYFIIDCLEYRFPKETTNEEVVNYLDDYSSLKTAPGLSNILKSLDPDTNLLFRKYLKVFAKFYKDSGKKGDFDGCSLGNLIFAGVFIDKGYDFNKTLDEIMNVFSSKINASLCNISKGENRFLCGLKEDGQFLYDEALMVEEQSKAKMKGIYLLEKQPDDELINKINKLPVETAHDYLLSIHRPPKISKKSKECIENCDILIYGSGTQYSSTFPSYQTLGVAEAVLKSKANIKAYVSNIKYDEDIYGYTCSDILDELGFFLGGKNDDYKSIISHVLYNRRSARLENGIKEGGISKGEFYKGVQVIKGEFMHPLSESKHCGNATASKLIDLYEEDKKIKNKQTDLTIFVSLHNRSLGVPRLIDEFLDIHWLKYFKRVSLIINGAEKHDVPKAPPEIVVKFTNINSEFPENDYFLDWLNDSEGSDFLMTLSGDGDYRLTDFYFAFDQFSKKNLGGIFGTRVQSRVQFQNALSSAYTENRLVLRLSQFGAFALSFLFSIRSGLLFTDPITGFRCYSRKNIKNRPVDPKSLKGVTSPSKLALRLINSGVDIGEVPVSYRTYSGFTDPSWRVKRALRSLIDLMFFWKK